MKSNHRSSLTLAGLLVCAFMSPLRAAGISVEVRAPEVFVPPAVVSRASSFGVENGSALLRTMFRSDTFGFQVKAVRDASESEQARALVERLRTTRGTWRSFFLMNDIQKLMMKTQSGAVKRILVNGLLREYNYAAKNYPGRQFEVVCQFITLFNFVEDSGLQVRIIRKMVDYGIESQRLDTAVQFAGYTSDMAVASTHREVKREAIRLIKGIDLGIDYIANTGREEGLAAIRRSMKGS